MMAHGIIQCDQNLVECAIADVMDAVRPGSLSFTVIDTRILPDPTSRDLRMHSRLHPQLAQIMTDHASFPELMKYLHKQALVLIRAPSRHPWTVVFVSKSGHHRSRWCTRVMAEIAVTQYTLKLGSITDLTDGMWGGSCG